MEALCGDIENRLAGITRKNYLGQWRLSSDWAQKMGIPALPVDPPQVAAYISDRSVELGRRPATLHSAAAAIAHIHRAVGLNNPCDNSDVRRGIKSATRRSRKLQRQAEALTSELLAEIRATTCRPRRGGAVGRVVGAAKSRGKADIAMICLMPDAMLRVSETEAVKWEDIEVQADGPGRLMIRRSRTDPEREGEIAFISRLTMKSLNTIQNGATDSDRAIGLRPNQISRRIKQAAWIAGLGNGFSGHSPRIGMARDLARAGTELTSLKSQAPLPVHLNKGTTIHFAHAVLSESSTLNDVKTEIT